MKYKKKRCQSQSFLDPRVCKERERERERERESGERLRERERERGREREREIEREREDMVSVKLFHIILTSMLHKQLSACTLLLCDVK